MSTPPAITVAPGSDRVRLAALAVDAAREVDGVAGLDTGPDGLLITSSGSTSVIGARVLAEHGGRYSIELGLQACLVPLNALAETVRGCVVRAITHAGLGPQLGGVSVVFCDISSPETSERS